MIKLNIHFMKLNSDHMNLLHEWFHIPHVLKWYARGQKFSLEMIREKYLPRINDVSIPNFIIYDHDTPIGYIQYYHLTDHLPEGVNSDHPLFKEFQKNELAGVDLFIANENYLDKGYGEFLLKKFIEVHLQEKFQAILVDPVKKNTTAITFFEKNGFAQITSQDKHHNVMILILRKE